MDERLQLLSYSALLKLHACPRKFQLHRLKATDDEMNPIAASNQNVTFAFGHIVGDGIQRVMRGDSSDSVYFAMFLGWHADLEACNDKQKKSFWLAMAAIQRFISMRSSGLLDDYELLEFNGVPAVELSFRITFPDEFKFRGSVDAVLRHKVTGEVIVLECKTSSSSNLNAAGYKNSAQGIGYSTILDVICPEINSYKVLYLVYKTKEMEYELLQFPKTYLQRATWIQELLLDIEIIKLYEATEVFPMRGENCYDFYRECEYYNQCTLSTSLITKPIEPEAIIDNKIYDIELTLHDLINGQLHKHEDLKASIIFEGQTFDDEVL